jgi:hypothetical protein
MPHRQLFTAQTEIVDALHDGKLLMEIVAGEPSRIFYQPWQPIVKYTEATIDFARKARKTRSVRPFFRSVRSVTPIRKLISIYNFRHPDPQNCLYIYIYSLIYNFHI